MVCEVNEKLGASEKVVAIDGPSASGKSTVAKRIAVEIGSEYLDTGAMYRAITFGVLKRQVDPQDRESVAEVLGEVTIKLGKDQVFVDGLDATQAIREPQISRSVSAVAANPAVRSLLVRLQQEWICQNEGGVVDGRDICTVVAPDAAVKVFVTASLEERARRRSAQSGQPVEEVAAELERRDHIDTTREDSPLQVAETAKVLDTTDLTIEDAVTEIVEMVKAVPGWETNKNVG